MTEKVHLALAVRLPPQGLVPLGIAVNSAELVSPVTLTVVVPLFVTVTVCGALVVPTSWLALKVKAAGANVSVAATPDPVPASATICVGNAPEMTKEPLIDPFSGGANVTE